MSKVMDARTGLRDMTPEEQAKYDAGVIEYNNRMTVRKLQWVRNIRNEKLQETDHLGLSDLTMSVEISTWRQTLRDVPQNYTTEEQHDLLLVRDGQGNLTHSVWSKP
jgi:hypothetical protein